ncbi:unnamed protein product [Paramecium pentaurelia]|uniref:F-box domain-containing protein n=1 Tax=Paramecium pentaurelia TaxID=43138 RepID=A0A8S1UR21_9CILI|nr:unnamed protein product [Paramecium pentaurelia]
MQKQTQLTKFFSKKAQEQQQSPIRTKFNSDLFFCTPPTQEIQCKTENYSNKKKGSNNLDNWIRKSSLQQKKWPFLPKNLIYQIYKFLQLRECATCSQVCKFWMICYNDIYFSYSFFREFETSRFNEKELATVLKRSSKQLKHIKKVREMIKGQKISSFLEKTELRTMLSDNSQQQGSLLELFKLEPKKQYTSVFLTDKDLNSICTESYKSLQYIQLISCQFMTGKGFEIIGKCTQLSLINIQNNSNLKDENINVILEQVQGLKTLMILKCDGLTNNIFEIIGNTCKKLERLDIGQNPQLDLIKCSSLKNIGTLQSFSIKDNIVTNEALEIIISSLFKLHSLNLEGCQEINTYSLLQIQKLHLQRINLKKISFKEEDIYNFILNAKSIKLMLVNNNLLSTRVEKIILSRQ